METRTLSIKAGWLLSLRLTTYILISYIVIFWLRYPSYLNFPFFAYSLLTLMLPVLFIFRNKFNIKFLIQAIPIVQIILEIVIEIGIIHATGNINSAFSAIFILTIISAALVTNLIGTLGIASLISLSYSFVVWFGITAYGEPDASQHALKNLFSSEDAIFYNIFLHILTFFLTAFISGFLVERLKLKHKELEDTSRALRKAKLETDDILRHLNSGLFTIDQRGRFAFFNQAAEEILGYRESEVKGRHYNEVFRERSSELANILNSVIQTNNENTRSDIRIRNGRGIEIPVGVSTSILKDIDNSIRGIIIIFQDLTETKELEQKIRAADKMAAVGELSAAIAHEIRNPLAAISGSVEVLQDELDTSDENRTLMKLIIKESNRLNNILTDFLLFARNQRAAFTRVELYRLISDVVSMIRHHPSYHAGINIRLSSMESIHYVYNDENQIRQILINLIVNACEAFEHNIGEIDIKLERSDQDSVEISISDDGPGISAEHQKNIFTPFYSTKKFGTGLGLAIVQRLANNLGIGLSCHSREGDGTLFFLTISAVPGREKESDRSLVARN